MRDKTGQIPSVSLAGVWCVQRSFADSGYVVVEKQDFSVDTH